MEIEILGPCPHCEGRIIRSCEMKMVVPEPPSLDGRGIKKECRTEPFCAECGTLFFKVPPEGVVKKIREAKESQQRALIEEALKALKCSNK